MSESAQYDALLAARDVLTDANRALVRAATGGEDMTEVVARVRAAAVEVARADAAYRQATSNAAVVTWSPPNAPHVSGTWSPRAFDEQGLPIPQRVECRCVTCGQTWGTLCGSGLVRTHVTRFALAHLHAERIGTRGIGPAETRRA